MYIGIDLGGTNIAAGVVDEAGKIIYKASVPTLAQRPIDEIVEDMANLCIDVVNGADCQISEIKSVGIGCPGTVDNKNGIVAYACNLRMQNTELGAMLEKKLGKPVNLENDANAAALGEYEVNGDNADSFVLITLGTGVGGGVIINGKILTGYNGGAGEIGHMHVDDNETDSCNCGRKGCLEQFTSATGVVRLAKRLMNNTDKETKMREFGENITAKDVFDLAKEGDAGANEVVETMGTYLGTAMSHIAVVVNPQAFIIGGGVSKAGQFLIDAIKDKYRETCFAACGDAAVHLATLGNDAGMYGAAAMICK